MVLADLVERVDRGEPRESQHRLGLLSAKAPTSVAQLVLEIVKVGFNKGLTSQVHAFRNATVSLGWRALNRQVAGCNPLVSPGGPIPVIRHKWLRFYQTL